MSHLSEEDLRREFRLAYLPPHLRAHLSKPAPFVRRRSVIVADTSNIKFDDNAWARYYALPSNVRNAIPIQVAIMTGLIPHQGSIAPQTIYLERKGPERVFELHLTHPKPIKHLSKQLRFALSNKKDTKRFDIYEGDVNLRTLDPHSLTGRDTLKWRVVERKIDYERKQLMKREKKAHKMHESHRMRKEPGHHELDVYSQELADDIKAYLRQKVKKHGRASIYSLLDNPTSCVPIAAYHVAKHPKGPRYLKNFGIEHTSHFNQIISSSIQQSIREELSSPKFDPSAVGCLFDTTCISTYLKNIFARFKTSTCYTRRRCYPQGVTLVSKPQRYQTVAVVTTPTPAPAPAATSSYPEEPVTPPLREAASSPPPPLPPRESASPPPSGEVEEKEEEAEATPATKTGPAVEELQFEEQPQQPAVPSTGPGVEELQFEEQPQQPAPQTTGPGVEELQFGEEEGSTSGEETESSSLSSVSSSPVSSPERSETPPSEGITPQYLEETERVPKKVFKPLSLGSQLGLFF
jgi:hypothetical protein